MRSLPPLTALRAFEAVGRHGVMRAAQQLNVTPAAVYHQIRALESDLGVTLFSRVKGKGLSLTRKGEEYLGKIASIFDQISESSRQIRAATPQKLLVIDSLTSFATDFLVPRLPRLLDADPDIQLQILTPSKGFSRIRFEKTGAQLAIRGGSTAGHWPGLHAEMLVHETMFPVCAPALLKGNNALRSPADLARHRLLDVPSTPEGWREWIDAAAASGEDMEHVSVESALKFDLIHLSTLAAVQGVGVDLARAPLVDRHLESGALVVPFDLKVRTKLSYWLICPEPFAETELYETFRGWILNELARSKYICADEPLRAVG